MLPIVRTSDLPDGGRHVKASPQWRRIARDIYAHESAPPDLVKAVQDGFRPTCLTAARILGIWTLPDRVLPMCGPHLYAMRGRTPLTGIKHSPYTHSWPETDVIASVPLLLEHAGRCQSPEHTAIMMESALNQHLIERDRLEEIIASLPHGISRSLRGLHDDAASGTETRVRRFFEKKGCEVRSQVHIPGVGPVDILVGKSWVIETDGRQYHSSPRQFENDRMRDLTLSEQGYRHDRLSYRQTVPAWRQTCIVLESILRTGAHLRAPLGVRWN